MSGCLWSRAHLQLSTFLHPLCSFSLETAPFTLKIVQNFGKGHAAGIHWRLVRTFHGLVWLQGAGKTSNQRDNQTSLGQVTSRRNDKCGWDTGRREGGQGCATRTKMRLGQEKPRCESPGIGPSLCGGETIGGLGALGAPRQHCLIISVRSSRPALCATPPARAPLGPASPAASARCRAGGRAGTARGPKSRPTQPTKTVGQVSPSV